MVVPRKEKAYEKHAWITFFALGILFLIAGLRYSIDPTPTPIQGNFASITGVDWNQFQATYPGVAFYFESLTRFWALLSLIGFVLLVAVSFKSYRKGERWAWYAFWMVPAVFLAFSADFLTYDGLTSYLFIGSLSGFSISLLGLFLPYRKFFPKKEAKP